LKTVSLEAPGSIAIVDQSCDNSFEKMAVLRVISSGICAADAYLWSGHHPWNISYPIVPGHEIFGEIIELAADASNDLALGSKVTVQVNVPCYTCESCNKKRFNMCLKRMHFGSTLKGSFAEQISIPFGARVHTYSNSIDDSIGGLSETMANAIYCSKKVEIVGHEKVLILGMGSIGACLVHYLKSTFVNLQITVLTSSIEKKKILQNFGIEAVSLSEMDQISDIFDVIFETSGYIENFKAGIKALKPNGKAMVYGVFQSEMSFDFNQISEFKELTLIGGHLANDEAFDLSVQFLAAHQNNLHYLISNIVSFSDFTSAFSNPKFFQFKTLFQPNWGGLV
jgi:2-desacetyl-2-hydroxyethyl bacteriochlorophyllide A dehydrogenase